MTAKSSILGFLCVVLVFGVQMATYARHQPRIVYGDGRGDDGVAYGKLADQIAAHQPIRGGAPFVYRLGGSFLAARYANALHVSVDDAYQTTNAAMTFLVLAGMYLIALRYCSPAFASLAVIMFSLPWFGLTRGVWFSPVHNDIPWLLLMLLAVLMIDAWSDENAAARVQAPLFALVCLIAPLTRELGVLAPMLWIATRGWVLYRARPAWTQWRKYVGLGVSYATCAALGLIATRVIATNTQEYHWAGGSYGMVPTALRSIKDNALWHLAVSVSLAWGGPLLALMLARRGPLARLFHRAPVLWVFAAAVLVLSYVGGVNTLRFLCWGSPIVLTVLAYLAQDLWRRSRATWAGLHVRTALLVGAAYYVYMIHPFSGYYADYSAWILWGGLQFSSFQSTVYLVPSLLLSAWLFIAVKLSAT